MELKQRKRIQNNLPRFDIGADATSAIGGNKFSINKQLYFDGSGVTNDKVNFNLSTGNKVQDLVNAGNNPQFSSGAKTFSGSNSGNSPAFDWKGTAVSGANAIGDLLSQNSKFDNSAARDIKSYGGAVAQMIPGKYGQVAKTAVDLASDTVGMLNYKHTGDEMRNQAGLSDTSINGINYTAQNAIDTGSAYRDVKSTGIKNALSGGFKGSATGLAVGGPIGAVVGGVVGNLLGVFSGRKAMIRQKRINRNALMQTEMLNQNQMAQADTEGLQNSYYRDNYDTTGTVLFGANHGKDLRSRKKLNNLTKV